MKKTADSLFEDQATIKSSAHSKIVVELNQDHPGFRDAEYRERRNKIAQIAYEHQPGTPVPDAPYTEDENKLWNSIIGLLKPVHQQWACQEFLEYWDKLQLPEHRIPQLQEVSAKMNRLGGFSFAPACGLALPRDFLMSLGSRVMLATQYIRHYSKPDYTPEPDVVHELVGHGAMLVAPEFVFLNELFGRVAAKVDDATIEKIIRLYWWSVEFGVVKEKGHTKAVGAGLLSSFGELQSMPARPLRTFDPKVMEMTDFDPTTIQPFYFCAAHSQELISGLNVHLHSYL